MTYERVGLFKSQSDSGLAALVQSVISARKRRGSFLNAELFAEPAWDVLLVLFAAALEQRRVTFSFLVAAARVPSTTLLRWIAKLEHEELIVRTRNPLDTRQWFVKLSPKGEATMRNYFEALPAGAAVV